MQDKRFSFTESMDFYGNKEDDEALSCLVREKPVFGEENMNRRRYTSDDFFDDIFRGDQYLSSTPRRRGKDPFSSAPGSRVLSPALPLPPKADPFGSSSLPPQFRFWFSPFSSKVDNYISAKNCIEFSLFFSLNVTGSIEFLH